MVEIKYDDIIRNKFNKGFARTRTVDMLVLHGTAGGTGGSKYAGDGVIYWMRGISKSKDPARYKYYRKGIALFHYLIERDGDLWNLIDPNRWVYHSSIGRYDGGTIGCELVNPSRKNAGYYEEAQYLKALQLFEYLKEKHFPQMTKIAGHGRMKQKISGGWKNCPGTGFDWSHMRDVLSDEGWDFKYQNPYESVWDIKRKATTTQKVSQNFKSIFNLFGW